MVHGKRLTAQGSRKHTFEGAGQAGTPGLDASHLFQMLKCGLFLFLDLALFEGYHGRLWFSAVELKA